MRGELGPARHSSPRVDRSDAPPSRLNYSWVPSAYPHSATAPIHRDFVVFRFGFLSFLGPVGAASAAAGFEPDFESAPNQ